MPLNIYYHRGYFEGSAKWPLLRNLTVNGNMYEAHYPIFLKQLPTMTALTKLNMYEFNPSHITPTLLNAVPNQLQVLNMALWNHKEEFADMLWRLTDLRRLTLSFDEEVDADVEVITPPLIHHASLTALEIQHWGLDASMNGLALSRLLAGLTGLQHLDLKTCYLDDEDAAKCVSVLRHHAQLRSLILTEGGRRDKLGLGKSGEALAAVLPHLPHLETLITDATDTSPLGLVLQQSLTIHHVKHSTDLWYQKRICAMANRNRVRQATLESLSCLPNQEKGSIVAKRPHRSSHVRT